MARPARPERNRVARSYRQLRRFQQVINSDKVFGTHSCRRRWDHATRPNHAAGFISASSSAPTVRGISGREQVNNRALNASAPGSFMMPNDFTNDKGKKLFRKLWIKFSSRRKFTETGDLLVLSAGFRRRQVV